MNETEVYGHQVRILRDIDGNFRELYTLGNFKSSEIGTYVVKGMYILKKKWLKSYFKEADECYFFILPSPSMIQRAEKGVQSSSLKANLASILLILPDNH